MGVHGLWRLIEPSGKPVPLETLENKVLAVDVSIWLHQAIKGFQDSKGAAVPNAHLLGIYHRVCKLLYFKIKPIFVFDGGVPVLKKQTIAKRNQSKARNHSEANKIQEQLITTLLKHSAISKVLSDKAKATLEAKTKKSPVKNNNARDALYILPSTAELDSTVSSSSEDEYSTSETTDSSPTKQFDLHTIETKSVHFKSLPADVRHEILTDLKETRKQSSWGRLHELPSQSDDFATFQMKRLLKRQEVQSALEEAEKEMGGHSLSLGELEKILKDQGVISNVKGQRIAADENARYLFIKDVKKAMEEAKQQEENKDEEPKKVTKADEEYDEDLKLAIALSLQDEPSTSGDTNKSAVEEVKKNLQFSFLDENLDSDDSGEFEEVEPTTKLTSAANYMKEYSGLTPAEIAKIIGKNELKNVKKSKIAPPAPPVQEVEISEDEDSDFEEVPEVINVSKEKEDIKPSLEVVVNPEDNLEDDLFSDIFESKESDEIKDVPLPKIPENLPPVMIPETKNKIREERLQSQKKSPEKIIKENGNKVKHTEVTKTESSPVKDTKEQAMKAVEDSVLTDEPSQHIVTIENPVKPAPALTVEELTAMKENLRNEQNDLLVERQTKERMATNITDQMYQEAQDLLELFGVPYIIAPMEAEAQCAFLDEADLTDGTITDDSDIWLFGGKTVYKNFFNQAKHVMEFKAESIKHHFKLSREQMILLALLVGSDYTTGLQGVGPVTALEILAAFPPSATNEINLTQAQLVSGLREFQMWFKKGKGKPRMSLKNKLKNVEFTESFPSLQVVQAYLEPKVETSKEPFSWGKPDVIGLIHFAREKFGWTQKKTDEILAPVMKKIAESTSQKSIKDYFKTKFVVQPGLADGKMSKRVKTAVDRIGKEPDEKEEVEKKKTRRQTTKKDGGDKAGPSGKGKGRRRKNNEEDSSPTKKLKSAEELLSGIPEELKDDEEVQQLQEVTKLSSNKVIEITNKLQSEIKTNETKSNPNKKGRGKRKKNEDPTLLANIPEELKDDKEVQQLQKISELSSNKVTEITNKLQSEIDQVTEAKPNEKIMKQEIVARRVRSMHKKEVIYQKQMDKNQMLRSKLKAIEVLRKSKLGPGYVKKNEKKKQLPKDDAELSESSSDE